MSKNDVKRDPTALYCDDPSLTQQQFAGECDINTIVRRAAANEGVATHVNARPGQYGDFTNIPDYRSAFDIVNRANLLFMDMPWEVRERFANNPQRMVEFLQKPENRDEAIKLGLVKAPEVPPVDSHLETLKSIDSSLKAKSKKSVDVGE